MKSTSDYLEKSLLHNNTDLIEISWRVIQFAHDGVAPSTHETTVSDV